MEQLEVLQLAAKHGYYDVPRGITLRELADRIDVSHQAVSERIRRAHGHLIGMLSSSASASSTRSMSSSNTQR
ncbi:helix-turn-helix domain-containing protein [Haladaptatus sp. W1]|uniref:helix-turn-helix domain-containing protein n=1 Tax=Haladaptatus sp. W1 TaxID=1897478 RepID=UPI0020C7751E|nr:helix-turn-helix domain-containing protein [Haladaptatus sp. W1]